MATATMGSWADVGDEFAAPDITLNPDGTKTVVTYRTNADGMKVKITQRIKDVVVQEMVHPLVAKRKTWKKFGKDINSEPGPDSSTTQLGERVELRLNLAWKQLQKEEEVTKAQSSQAAVGQTMRCRTCSGSHFTSHCPYKETLGAPAADLTIAEDTTQQTGKYLPRHMRMDAQGNIPTREARDDSTSLKISQLNSIVDENMIRNELLARFAPLERVNLVRSRETGESRGFAYVNFATEELAQSAIDTLNGKGYHSLILHLDWSKKKKPL